MLFPEAELFFTDNAMLIKETYQAFANKTFKDLVKLR